MGATYRIAISHIDCVGKAGHQAHSFPAEPETFARYFSGENVACACNADWFDVIQEYVERWPQKWTVTDLMGGLVAHIDLDVSAGKTTTLSLDEIGVPLGAEVFDVNLMFQGGPEGGLPFVPAILTGNEIHFDPFPRTLRIHGVPLSGKGELAVSVSVRYVPPGDDEVPRLHLCEAGRHFIAGRFDGIVIPSNIAVEASLGRALTLWLEDFRPPAEVERFLSDGATYAHQLNVMIPLAARDLGLNELPPRIKSGLDDLRRYRNDIAHRGHPYRESRPPLAKESGARLLVAALFGYHYTRFLRTAVEARQGR